MFRCVSFLAITIASVIPALAGTSLVRTMSNEEMEAATGSMSSRSCVLSVPCIVQVPPSTCALPTTPGALNCTGVNYVATPLGPDVSCYYSDNLWFWQSCTPGTGTAFCNTWAGYKCLVWVNTDTGVTSCQTDTLTPVGTPMSVGTRRTGATGSGC